MGSLQTLKEPEKPPHLSLSVRVLVPHVLAKHMGTLLHVVRGDPPP